MSVLIAFSTAHNTTTSIANRIASRLTSTLPPSISVTTKPITSIPTNDPAALSPYNYIIVGSAIHMTYWLPPARKFLSAHHTTLASKPVWAFSVGVPGTEAYEAREIKVIEKDIRKSVPELKGHVLFKGKSQVNQLAWPVALFFKWFPSKGKFGDFVEWEKIDEWADGVGEEIKKGAEAKDGE